MKDPATIARESHLASVQKDRAAIEALIDEDFHFTTSAPGRSGWASGGHAIVLRGLLLALAAALLGLFAYEGYRLHVARGALDDAFAPYRAAAPGAGPGRARLDVIVKVQDPAFMTHKGIEWPSPLTTTTITQSVVKRLFFASFRPGFRKIEQTLIAWLVVDPHVSKEVQLRAFVQTAYFGEKDGHPIEGIDAAAQAWFNAPAASLDDEQFLSLVAMLPAPNALAPGTAASRERVARIKRLLAGACSHTHVSGIGLAQCA